MDIILGNLPKHKALAIVCFIICNILPAFAFFFEFEKPIFYSLDLVKLLLLCAAVTLPIFLLNICLAALFLVDEKGKEKYLDVFLEPGVIMVSVTLIPIFFIPCALTYFVAFNVNVAIGIAIVFEIVILLFIKFIMAGTAD